MSNSTPKRGLSGLIGKFRLSGSGESSSSSSAENEGAAGAEQDTSDDEVFGLSTSDVAISPLALMNENSPEAWLGQFLLKLEAPTSTARGTLEGAKRDAELLQYLQGVRASSAGLSPLGLLDPEYAAKVRADSWGTWWKGQGALLSYAYATLALSLLGERGHTDDLRAIYLQTSNMQMQKDAHYVLCYMLGKHWPSYNITDSDFARLSAGV